MQVTASFNIEVEYTSTSNSLESSLREIETIVTTALATSEDIDGPMNIEVIAINKGD